MRPKRQRLHSAELRRLDNIIAALDRIATAIEKHPTTEIDRIDIGEGVGVQDGGTTEINSDNKTIEGNKNVIATRSPAAGSEIESSQIQFDGKDNILQHQTGSGMQQGKGGPQGQQIVGNKESFNTNSHDAIKNLTEALQTKHRPTKGNNPRINNHE